MATNIPFDFEATLVGRIAARAYKDRETGADRMAQSKLQFLVRHPAGAVELIEVGTAALDKATPPVDHESFSVGDLVRLGGVCVIQDRGSDRDSYVGVRTAELATASAVPTPLKDASSKAS